MRCRFHPFESNLVGVCASCLRERLEALVAEKQRRRRILSQLSSTSTSSSSIDCPSSTATTTTATTVTFTSCPDFPLPLPRSTSPYVVARDRHNLFFSPQHLNPTAKKERNKKKHHLEIPDPNSDNDIAPRKDKKKLSFLSTFFGRRQKKSKGSCADARVPESSSSLFSKIITGRRRKTPPIPTGS